MLHRRIVLILALTALAAATVLASMTNPPVQASGNTIATVATFGNRPSLVIDAAGNPAVSYTDTGLPGPKIKLLRCGNPSCSSGNTIKTIASQGDYSSLVISALNTPTISYYDPTTEELKLASCSDATCTAAPTIVTLDTAGNVGQFNSMAVVPNQHLTISYYEASGRDLKVFHCVPPACSSPTIVTPDGADDVGRFSSIAIDASGNPVISYLDESNADLKVLHCGDSACSSGNSITIPDGSGGINVGSFSSLELDASGNPVISYWADIDKDLKLLFCGDANCSSGNTILIADSAGDVGEESSLALSASHLAMSYYDRTNGRLRIFHCDPTTAATCLSTKTIVSPSPAGKFRPTSVALDSSGNAVAAFADPSDSLTVVHCNVPSCGVTKGPLTVNSAGDESDVAPGDGACQTSVFTCTLRAALEEANSDTTSANTISFQIAPVSTFPPALISPATPLPVVTGPVVIDGTTQCCYAGIELDGSLCVGCTNGLEITAGGSTVRGLIINDFPGAGVALIGPNGNNQVRQVFIGTDITPAGPEANGGPGVLIEGSSSNSVGPGGVLSGNAGPGVLIKASASNPASNNSIKSTAIGTNGAGTGALPNGGAGVEIDGSGTQPVTGNIVGVAGSGNAIAGNTGAGVWIHGAMASDNTVRGNSIGSYYHCCPQSITPLGNGSHGVHFSDGAHDNDVGNAGPTNGNDIGYNAGAGVAIEGGGTGNSIRATISHDNGGLGIDHAPLGVVTPFYDAALTSALYCAACAPGGLTAVTGYTRGGPPNAVLLVDIYRSPSCDPSGYGEATNPIIGSVFYGPGTFTTNGNGDISASGAFTNQGSTVGQYITTTVTPPDGTTTEYSNCVRVKADSDNDGIENSIDTMPNTFSNDASDIPLGGGGTSFATIVSRGTNNGCYVSIVDLPNPQGGVVGTICTVPGSDPVELFVCGTATIQMMNGTSVQGTCGSVHLQVDLGPVTTTFGGWSATLGTKTEATITDFGGGSYQIEIDPSSASSISAGGVTIAPGDTMVLDPTTDVDGDGCPSGNEQQTAPGSQTSGGRRDYLNPWDYFNPTHDGVNRVDDILAVVNQYYDDEFLPSPPNPPNTPNPAYNPDTDRSGLGPNPWNLGPPDGLQRVDDILAIVNQYFHDCS